MPMLVKDNTASWERFPRDEGMVPVMLLFANARNLRDGMGMLLIPAGTIPFSRPLLLLMYIVQRLTKRPMLLGMTPVSMFFLK